MDAFPQEVRTLLSRAQWRPCSFATSSENSVSDHEVVLKAVCHTVHGVFVVVSDFRRVGLVGSLSCHDAASMVQTAAPGIVIEPREMLRLFDDALESGSATLVMGEQQSLRVPVTVNITQREHVVLQLPMPLVPAVASGPSSGALTLHAMTTAFLMDVGVVPLAVEAHALRHVLETLIRLRRIDADDLTAIARQSLQIGGGWQHDSATHALLTSRSCCLSVPLWLDVVRQLCFSSHFPESGSTGSGGSPAAVCGGSRGVEAASVLRPATHAPNYLDDGCVEVRHASSSNDRRSSRRAREEDSGRYDSETHASGATAVHSMRPAKADEMMKKYRKALR